MQKQTFVKVAIPILAILLLNSVYLGLRVSSVASTAACNPYPHSNVPVGAGYYDFPRLNTLYCVEAWPWTTALTMAQECKIDDYLSAIQTSAIDSLNLTYSWTVTHSGGAMHYCYMGFNCREYAPTSPLYPTDWTDYHGRTPGFALFPLNESSFRYALPFMYGCNKTAWCWNLLSYIVVRNDFPMPSGFTEWRNPFITEFPLD